MIIYILYFIFFAILALEYEFRPFKSKFLLATVALLLVLLAGFRGVDVDKDYENYQLSFDLIYDIANDPSFLSIYEPGFLGIVLLARYLFEQNYGLVIMAFIALMSVFLKVESIKRFPINPYLIILFYFSHYFILQEMTQIRIGIASAIFLISLPYYFKGNKALFVGLILLATAFHYTAICFLIVLLFNSDNFKYSIFFSMLALSLIFAFVKLPWLNFLRDFNTEDISGKLNNYTDLVEYGVIKSINVFNAINISNILCSVYLILFVPKSILITNKQLNFYLKCNILSIFLLSFLSGVPSVAFRFSELFGTVSIFLFGYLIKMLPAGKYNILLLIFLAGSFFYINIFYGKLLKPYQIINIQKY